MVGVPGPEGILCVRFSLRGLMSVGEWSLWILWVAAVYAASWERACGSAFYFVHGSEIEVAQKRGWDVSQFPPPCWAVVRNVAGEVVYRR